MSRKVLLNHRIHSSEVLALHANSCFTAESLFLGGGTLRGYSSWGGSRWRDGFPPSSQRPGRRDSGRLCRSRSKRAPPRESPECVTHSRSSWDLERLEHSGNVTKPASELLPNPTYESGPAQGFSQLKKKRLWRMVNSSGLFLKKIQTWITSM